MSATIEPRARAFHAQAVTGVGLAALVLTAWIACHVYSVFFFRWSPIGFVIAPVLVAVQCWLNVGLFIIAHDCMHGSLAPFRPQLNRLVGRVCLFLYAGFSFDRLIKKHFDHHRHPGTALDPDFNDEDPEHFWRWYMAFFRRYFGWHEIAFITAVIVVYWGLIGVGLANVIVLWAVPAILSSFQLFYFGTYLPHRHEDEAFTDAHNARSNDFSYLLSLLTCFHFGYHHEHHVAPNVPWWQLPRQRNGGQPA